MNKTFYKRKAIRKVFFDKNMTVRSHAYGESVREAFVEWQKYYYSTKGPVGDRLVISSQKNITGGEGLQDGTVKLGTYSIYQSPLKFDTLSLLVTEDGCVSVNGERSELRLGSELKAWAIATVAEKGIKKHFLCVIGKPADAQNMSLSLYPITKRGPLAEAEYTQVLPHTMSDRSFLICLGRHIFLVHNSKLEYFYINLERGELERVAIGDSNKEEEYAPCLFVAPRIAASTVGTVFWLSGEEVYGFLVGYPRRLIHIPSAEREVTVDIACKGDSLLVYRKSKSTARISCTRYTKNSDGIYVGKTVDNDSSDRSISFGRR